ncbi:STAS domain-containing protein [Microbulbifer hydrolyticus]|uniref:Anti-anti-sigma factor n=1 Tax=Microbulbifer hydrolyticus TaxID=48074 RepID=A0A6P1TE88_9GAMM|nr:STAS domain-containing protein [Microbulbifer hydrolyticus]MBB5212328.1 anti-anti-sigma factor [Microbulbifer hydrolyticus]QHQ39975.1 anti-sigma factor antagonist [Microbulbifer hydrolyticus]
MQSGQIMVGDHQGIYVVKLVGDVRLNLCTSFDNFIDKMFSHGEFRGVVFDMHDTDGVDSTTLGLMAKIAFRSAERNGGKPLVLCEDRGLLHLLDSMGFEELMDISSDADNDAYQVEPAPLKCNAPDEHTARDMVLEAHRVLMSMNEQNEATFRDLVHALETEQDAQDAKSVVNH